MAKRMHSIDQRKPAPKQDRRWIYIGLISLVAVIVVGVLIFMNQPAAPTSPDSTPVAFKAVPKPNGMEMGNPNAKVTVEEYSDFQCPYCKLFFTDTEPTLIEKYIATDQVHFVYNPFSFIGAESKLAAEAAFCSADQNKFWEMHTQIFSAQATENGGNFTNTSLTKMASQSGLEMAAFKSCLEKGTYKQKVEDFNTKAMGRKVQSTPSFFVNGVGPLNSNQVLSEVEKALKGQ